MSSGYALAKYLSRGIRISTITAIMSLMPLQKPCMISHSREMDAKTLNASSSCMQGAMSTDKTLKKPTSTRFIPGLLTCFIITMRSLSCKELANNKRKMLLKMHWHLAGKGESIPSYERLSVRRGWTGVCKKVDFIL